MHSPITSLRFSIRALGKRASTPYGEVGWSTGYILPILCSAQFHIACSREFILIFVNELTLKSLRRLPVTFILNTQEPAITNIQSRRTPPVSVSVTDCILILKKVDQRNVTQTCSFFRRVIRTDLL